MSTKNKYGKVSCQPLDKWVDKCGCPGGGSFGLYEKSHFCKQLPEEMGKGQTGSESDAKLLPPLLQSSTGPSHDLNGLFKLCMRYSLTHVHKGRAAPFAMISSLTAHPGSVRGGNSSSRSVIPNFPFPSLTNIEGLFYLPQSVCPLCNDWIFSAQKVDLSKFLTPILHHNTQIALTRSLIIDQLIHWSLIFVFFLSVYLMFSVTTDLFMIKHM